MIDTPKKLDKWMKKHNITRKKLPALVNNSISERTVYRILKNGTCLGTWLKINFYLKGHR